MKSHSHSFSIEYDNLVEANNKVCIASLKYETNTMRMINMEIICLWYYGNNVFWMEIFHHLNYSQPT